MIIPSYYPLIGGAELQLAGLSNELTNQGVRVNIVTRRLSLAHSKKENINEIPVERLFSKLYPFGFIISLALYLVKHRKFLDVIHVHTLNSPAIVAAIFGRVLLKKVLIKVTRSGTLSQISRFKGSLFGRLYLKCLIYFSSNFVAITQDVKNELLSIGVPREKIIVIPNGVKVSKALSKSNKRIEFLFVGRLIKRKRVDLLLEAWELSGAKEKSRLTIIGDGPEKQPLVKIVNDKKLSASVRVLGEKNQIEVFSIMKQSDVFVLPSDSEGMSNSLLEAMSFGNIPLVSNIQANLDIIIDGKTGYLFDSTEMLSKLIKEMIISDVLRGQISTNVLNAISSKYAMSIIAKQYMDFYKK